MEVEYLGIKISSDGKIEEEVRHRVAGCLNDTIWKTSFYLPK